MPREDQLLFVLLVVALEDRLKVLPAIKYALDQHPVGCNDKGNGNSPFETDRTQSGHEIIAPRAAFWKVLKPLQ
ncbi:hypothetical protein GCM10007874_00590 [Labrys miyagiensis]|uniref:Uncharacterized protein n=1 Tax=Labrys miyagiensis TaxID=346912 RepID=A0ABQ6CB48_9HYPH|nr:hypothetical protein GCM10007874_00590 [Labrys miyagiensis]